MVRLTRFATFLLPAFLFAATTLLGQHSDPTNRQQGDYIVGLNGGVAYQQGDVSSRLNGFGLGLTYGKNLYYKPYAPFSFDLRSRLQLARTYGMDIRPSLGLENNDALNGERDLDYTGDLEGGLVYPNHRTNHAEAGLEGVATLNGLRDATGLGLSFTGGVGVQWYKAKIDQRNADGLYADQYQRVDADGSKPYNLSQLRGLWDGEYETRADNFGRLGKFGIMPSLGVELDYDLTDNVSLGLGHRVTFSGTDLLDGQRWTNNNTLTGNNDVLHYTSLGVKYRFNQGASRAAKGRPTIEFVRPNRNGTSTDEARLVLLATVRGVNNPFDVRLEVNGREVPFQFNKDRLSADLALRTGENKISITATNKKGTTTDAYFITRRGEVLDIIVDDFGSPEIVFLRPVENLRTDEQRVNLEATVRLVDRQENIDLHVNGQRQSFRYDPGRELLTATLNLSEGRNTIELTAENRNGTQRASRVVVRERPLSSPTVRFLQPSRDDARVNQPLASIKAAVTEVRNAEAIQLYVNGRSISSFRFDERNGWVTAEISLQEGPNEVALTVRNRRGEDRASRTIIRNQPRVPSVRQPRVRITSPRFRESSTREDRVFIEAEVENVAQRQDIRWVHNGNPLFDFDYDARYGRLRQPVYLQPGLNQISIEVINEAGRDGANVTINLEPPVLPPPVVVNPPIVLPAPSVDLLAPRRNETFDASEITVKANLAGVQRPEDISFSVNGHACADFRFNPNSGRFRSTIPLEVGRNRIEISVRNEGGRDRQRVTVYHEPRRAPSISWDRPVETTQLQTLSVRAKIEHAPQKTSIALLLNGQPVRDFRWRDEQLSANLELSPGNNHIELVASNPQGTAREEAYVMYHLPQPPVVSMEDLQDRQVVSTNRLDLRASVAHVRSKRDIKLFVNGVAVRSYAWKDGQFTAPVQLKKGDNSIVLRATNDFGREEKRLRITYREKSADIAIEKSTATRKVNSRRVVKANTPKIRKP